MMMVSDGVTEPIYHGRRARILISYTVCVSIKSPLNRR